MLVYLPEPILRRVLTAVNYSIKKSERRLRRGRCDKDLALRSCVLARHAKALLENALHGRN